MPKDFNRFQPATWIMHAQAELVIKENDYEQLIDILIAKRGGKADRGEVKGTAELARQLSKRSDKGRNGLIRQL